MEKNCKTCKHKNCSWADLPCHDCILASFSNWEPADTPPAEKVERFEKVYVKTEADLPKEEGDYMVMKANREFYEDWPYYPNASLLNRDGFLAHVEWWLRPVK